MFYYVKRPVQERVALVRLPRLAQKAALRCFGTSSIPRLLF
jgi:hypothetical protein